MSDFLQQLIPITNRLDVAAAGAEEATGILEAIYESGFVGAFADSEDQPTWARRAARYLADEFLYDTPGRIKFFGDVPADMLMSDGTGECHANCRYALEQWEAGGKQGVKPYSTAQNYGSCVDASASEHETTLFGWRAAHPEILQSRGEQPEQFRYSAAWFKYADRGYCGDGWSGSGIATVARRVGAAFRTPYQIGGNSVDFTGDDENEQIVARQWCRSGIPAWLSAYTQANHGYADGAVTRMQGGLAELRKLLAAGGVLHHSGTFTSGGSVPFTTGSTGAHMQSCVGYDDSDQFRQFCRDVLKISPRDNDYPVINHQTWGRGWRGECADQYWPTWWGPKPEGAWVCWASTLYNRTSWDYAWLPWVKGFASTIPTPTPTPTIPSISGDLYGESIGGTITIRGELATEAGERYIVVPKPQSPGVFVVVPRPVV